MRKSSSGPVYTKPEPSRLEPTRLPSLLVLLIIFALGLAGGAYFFNRSASSHSQPTTERTADEKLSAGTLAVLKELNSPVTIRFYALLDPATISPVTKDFATRVSYLLSAYQREAGNMIKVTRFTSIKDVPSNKAVADGIRAFNLDKGEACFLGIALEHKDQKESFAQLSPDWETALEADLTRAIIRVTASKPPGRGVVVEQKVNPALIEEIKRALPDVTTLSLAEGTRILREKTMIELEKTNLEMETQLKAAEDRFAQAQSSNSESAQQAAGKELQRIRTMHSEKIRKLAMHLQDQISTLEQMKKK
jgi:hypothetical protein